MYTKYRMREEVLVNETKQYMPQGYYKQNKEWQDIFRDTFNDELEAIKALKIFKGGQIKDINYYYNI